ncbi:hypothetical protein [Sphingobacterium sp. LRF_L2]|uniref:hypothetical protein n=1 Tax=Sphingobacterium sp. LRF_L2 TaxID=3369421 RepID=UPI003F625B0C
MINISFSHLIRNEYYRSIFYVMVSFLLLSQQQAYAQKISSHEFFDIDQTFFNGKVKRFHNLSTFKKYFGEADSSKLLIDESPCSYIFEYEDGSKDAGDKYLYKNGSRFENNGDSVAVDEFRFQSNNFIKYKDSILDGSTTIEALRKLFPNAVKDVMEMDVFREGKLQVITLFEDAEHLSDGQVRIFLKNGKLYFMHWWFPC